MKTECPSIACSGSVQKFGPVVTMSGIWNICSDWIGLGFYIIRSGRVGLVFASHFSTDWDVFQIKVDQHISVAAFHIVA